MKNKSIPKWAWDFYQAKQGEALNCPNDATEVVLGYLVRIFESGETPENLAELERMVDNHLAGDRQKTRRRLRLLEDFGYQNKVNAEFNQPDVRVSDSIGLIQRNVTLSQWELLEGLANGDSYRQVSVVTGLPTGSVKSYISRIRKQLRGIIAKDRTVSFAA